MSVTLNLLIENLNTTAKLLPASEATNISLRDRIQKIINDTGTFLNSKDQHAKFQPVSDLQELCTKITHEKDAVFLQADFQKLLKNQLEMYAAIFTKCLARTASVAAPVATVSSTPLILTRTAQHLKSGLENPRNVKIFQKFIPFLKAYSQTLIVWKVISVELIVMNWIETGCRLDDIPEIMLPRSRMTREEIEQWVNSFSDPISASIYYIRCHNTSYCAQKLIDICMGRLPDGFRDPFARALEICMTSVNIYLANKIEARAFEDCIRQLMNDAISKHERTIAEMQKKLAAIKEQQELLSFTHQCISHGCHAVAQEAFAKLEPSEDKETLEYLRNPPGSPVNIFNGVMSRIQEMGKYYDWKTEILKLCKERNFVVIVEKYRHSGLNKYFAFCFTSLAVAKYYKEIGAKTSGEVVFAEFINDDERRVQLSSAIEHGVCDQLPPLRIPNKEREEKLRIDIIESLNRKTFYQFARKFLLIANDTARDDAFEQMSRVIATQKVKVEAEQIGQLALLLLQNEAEPEYLNEIPTTKCIEHDTTDILLSLFPESAASLLEEPKKRMEAEPKWLKEVQAIFDIVKVIQNPLIRDQAILDLVRRVKAPSLMHRAVVQEFINAIENHDIKAYAQRVIQ